MADSAPQEWRITDGDRHFAVQALGEHYAAGRLDKAEFDERSERAYAARTNLDLPPLFADLPEPHGLATTLSPVTQAGPAAPAARTRPVGYRRSWPHGVPFPLLPLAILAVVVGLHFFWVVPLLFVGFWVLRSHRGWHHRRGF